MGPFNTDEEARKGLTPLWEVSKEINHRIASWGPKVLGRRWEGCFGTAFGVKDSTWPFAEPGALTMSSEGLARPRAGKLVRVMSPNLIAGVLTRASAGQGRAGGGEMLRYAQHDGGGGERPLVMVVDCRVSNGFGDVPARAARVRFDRAVTAVRVLEGGKVTRVEGREVTVALQAGEGQMLELEGEGLEALCGTRAIYAAGQGSATTGRALVAEDLVELRGAKLQMEICGSDGGEYAAKYISLNGERIAQVPTKTGDSWAARIIELPRERLGLIGMRNEVTVRTECGDAWKFRNVTLAVQLADGTWARTNTDATAHSVADWAYSEGTTWGKDGVAGGIVLEFH